jgi:hypothetical protein
MFPSDRFRAIAAAFVVTVPCLPAPALAQGTAADYARATGLLPRKA